MHFWKRKVKRGVVTPGGGHAGGEHVTRAAPTWPTLQTARRTSVVGGIRRRRLGGRRGCSWAPETPHRRPARLCPLPGAIPAACGVFRGSEEVVGVCECGVHADPGRYWRALGWQAQGRASACDHALSPRAAGGAPMHSRNSVWADVKSVSRAVCYRRLRSSSAVASPPVPARSPSPNTDQPPRPSPSCRGPNRAPPPTPYACIEALTLEAEVSGWGPREGIGGFVRGQEISLSPPHEHAARGGPRRHPLAGTATLAFQTPDWEEHVPGF